MRNLENFLKSYEINLEYFDLEVFEDEIMDIPYQVEFLKQHFNEMSKEEKEKFFRLNKKLQNILKNIKPQNKLQEKIIFQIKKVI